MAKYRFAIDETGSFTMAENDKSFVCGVLISQDELTIKQKYQQAYKEFGLGDAPNDTKSIIGMEAFHFNSLSGDKKRICREVLLPLADKIYVSRGKPMLFANNQNWWLVAVTVVVQEFIKSTEFERGDKVEILIDNRNDKTFGLIDDDGIENPGFKEYHNILKSQIVTFVNALAKSRGMDVEVTFLSDTCSFYINLADVVCGFVRKESSIISQSITECPCSRFMNGDDPLTFIEKNPVTALSLIFQEIANDKFDNMKYLGANFFKKLRKDSDNYLLVWDMFYDLVKSKIEERATNSNLIAMKPFVNVFLSELKNAASETVPASKRLEVLVLFVEYYSHIGETTMPFEKDLFMKALTSTGKHSETRLLRKWEKYVSYTLRSSQIMFNGYNFSEAVSLLGKAWDEQEKIISSVPDIIFNDNDRKDEPTTALIGTLAQSYAYSGELKQAVEYFELSRDYAIRTSSQTDSYLFTIYHRQMDIEKAREQFELQTGKTPEEYASKNDFNNVWNLLSYCKLRALELYKNESTNLPAVDLVKLDKYNSEYPFPLIMKWEGIALWIENPDKNKTTVENYFTDAITNLSKKDNGFAIKTLVLPIIQCYALVNNQNPFHAQYNNYLADFKKQSDCFSDFIEQSSTLLNYLKNNADFWERSLSLPFIYA